LLENPKKNNTIYFVRERYLLVNIFIRGKSGHQERNIKANGFDFGNNS
jgi:hypothetical protein